MPRIRTIKPEFWDSPSTAKAGPWARLLFVAMWNWADDYGRGTFNPKELEGFAFPHDSQFTDRDGNTATFRHVVKEVSDAFGVVFYSVEGRDYYAIPSWERHQRSEKRSGKSRYPEPPAKSGLTSANAESDGNTATFRHVVKEMPRSSVLGTGEQGNRGTGEQSSSSELRPDVESLLDHLDNCIVDAKVLSKTPRRNKQNIDAARLLLDRDGRNLEDAKALIDWATHDSFWAANIGSMVKFREKYDQLNAQCGRHRASQPEEELPPEWRTPIPPPWEEAQ